MFQASPLILCRSAVARKAIQSTLSANDRTASVLPGLNAERQHSAANRNSNGTIFFCRWRSDLSPFPALGAKRVSYGRHSTYVAKGEPMSRVSSFKRFWQLGPRRRYLLVEATFGLAVAAAAIAILPFRKAVSLGSLGERPGSSKSPESDVGDICWSVKAAAARVPWRAMCFERGLAAQWMLRRRGHDAKLVYGARLGEAAGLDAHVWVTLDDRTLIGGEQASGYQRLTIHPEWSV